MGGGQSGGSTQVNGFVQLHRKIIDWEWYKNSNTCKLFIHCLLKANHTLCKWEGITIKRGQFVTGRKKLALETGLSEQECRTALDHLKATKELTIKATKRYSIITVNNWQLYQTKQPSNKPTSNQQATTNNNDNNDNKNIRGRKFIPPSIEEVETYCLEKGYSVNAESFVNYYQTIGWMIGKNKIKDWKAAVRNWHSRSKENKPKEEDNYSYV